MSNINTWANMDRYVDPSISPEGADFINPARVIVYSRPSGNSTAEFKPIGAIQGWGHSEQRQMDELFEIGSEKKYVIPGRTFGSIQISRILLNGIDLANALYDSASGDEVIRSIRDIARPVDLLFVAYKNQTGSDSAEELFNRQFSGCWISARSENLSANQTITLENCQITYALIPTTGITT